MTITGTSGSGSNMITQTTAISLTGDAAASGNFTLSASPTSLTTSRGSHGTSRITINRSGGFAGSVAFTATGMGGGTTVSFNPSSTTGNSTVLTLTVSAR